MALNEQYGFRAELIERLKLDLLGPTSEDEELDDAPATRYITGILYPQENGALDASEEVDASDDSGGEELAAPDPPVAMANVRYPSSMGITFAVDATTTDAIRLSVSAGQYIPVEAPEGPAVVLEEQPDIQLRRAGRAQRWKRQRLEGEVTIDVTKPTSNARESIGVGLELFYRVRPAAAGAIPITAVLLNKNSAESGKLRDAQAFFQPLITARSIDGSAAFVERPSTAGGVGDDADLRSYRLLYRHAKEFGIGHGCSVEWTQKEPGSDRAELIRSSYAPQYGLALAESNSRIELRSLGMRYLAEEDRSSVLEDLKELPALYDAWIKAREADAKTFSGELFATAADHIKLCREASRRIARGLDLLRADDLVWEAFRLANEAMLDQRSRTVWLAGGAGDAGPQRSDEHRWRAFQLAFMLLCIPGIATGSDPERELVDLLWFPTGGGKTEAYLALIAFTILLRRLRNPEHGDGVTVLMRYTLRLLTVQQFERAGLLICACEALRRRAPARLGEPPIAIGLWVGEGGTPNTRGDARKALDRLRAGAIPETGNPVQVQSCPWCGTPLGPNNYFLRERPSARLTIACRNKACEFRDELPIFVVDEDIYDSRPSLVIATVDKFASLPWREQTARLFNLDVPGALPPELIIQDELHLISGPLGTLVGLYETAIDCLCMRDGRKPKVIASTATIRRADRQSIGLFNRTVRQFPPPGLDARDSFFAVDSNPNERGDRLYLGLMAPGTSHTTLLVRAYASLLQNAQDIPGLPDTKDPYWTLVGYFNSLRVLGGARMQVQDDVGDRMALLARQEGATPRDIENRIELTSRESSAKIPGYLKWMAMSLPNPEALAVILATNMISVGVDIDRLGLMVVMGQPQSTSEYIQSTSRVGRRYPGLVTVLFNAARSRDRSHYESFVAYHSALYRQVESTSVTPFSPRARDRGLHAVLIALVRLLLPNLRRNASAGAVGQHLQEVEAVRDLIVARTAEISPDEESATRGELDELIRSWVDRAQTPGLRYRDNDPDKALLIAAGTETPDTDALPTLWSLRDVDRSSNLFVIE